MKSFTRVKTLSKILIYFSFVAVIAESALYIVNRNQASADPPELIEGGDCLEDSYDSRIRNGDINIWVQSPTCVKKNKPFYLGYGTDQGLQDVKRFSVFFTKTDFVDDYTQEKLEDNPSLICDEKNSIKEECSLCLKMSHTAEHHGDILSENSSWGDSFFTYSEGGYISEEIGEHRIVVVVSNGNNAENNFKCVASGVNKTIIGFNAQNTFTTLPATNDEETSREPTAPSTPTTTTTPSTTTIPTATSGLDSIDAVIKKIGNLFSSFIGVLAFFALVIGGFQYMTSAGNPDQQTKAKKTITYAIVGIVLAIISFAIVASIVDIINKILSGTGPTPPAPSS